MTLMKGLILLNKLKEESGYTLLVTILVLVLFTVLGFSLFTLTISGVSKNESRESNVQAKDLSVKGIEYLVTKIQFELNDYLAEGKNATDYKEKLETTLNQHLCTGTPSYLDNTETGKTDVCISDIINKAVDNPYKKVVTFHSIGTASGKEFTVESTYEIGADLNLNPFSYVISTFFDDAKDADKGGDLELFGGVEVTGNMNVAGDLITNDKSKYKSTIIDSVLPRVYNAKLNLLGDSYLQDKSNKQAISHMFYNSTIQEVSETCPSSLWRKLFKVRSVLERCPLQLF